MDGQELAAGIKLFGATIPVKVTQQAKEDDQPNKADDHLETEKNRAPEKVIPCPRCKSMETKFCYFNNYNVNQPRHFCKGCQRYWTAGGALRNVPVGAGRRKNRPPLENCSLDASRMQQLEFDHHHHRGVVEEWQLDAAGQSGLRQVFPAKRRRSTSAGQSC